MARTNGHSPGPRPTPREQAFDAIRKVAQQHVCRIQNSFHSPNDDWPPFLVVYRTGFFDIFAIDENSMRSVDGRLQVFTELIPRVIKNVNGEVAAFSSSAWYLELYGEEDTPVEEVADRVVGGSSLRDVPGRIEVVQLYAVESLRAEFWKANIIRSAYSPPDLGQWELKWTMETQQDMVGRVVEPMRRALLPLGG